MKITFTDYGAVSTVTITSSIFSFRKHDRVVRTTLYLVPGTVSERRGLVFIKTFISGYAREALRAYKVAIEEMKR
ncbi:hypothetical protein RF847_004631 [Salmonella enterica]|nr:hypothetical protein [Salmonella enterica]